MRYFYMALTLVVALLAADFAVSNLEPASLGFWPVSSHLVAPLYLVVLPVLVVGFLVGRLLGWLANGRLRTERRRQARRIAQLEAELRQAAAPLPLVAPAGPPLTEQQRATLLMSAH